MDSTERVVYIYALCDPRDGRVRYVGQTVNPTGRLSHYRNPSKRQNGPVQGWIDEILAAGFSPDMRLLEIVPSEQRNAAELRWMRKMREENPDLLNAYEPRVLPATSRLLGRRQPATRELLQPLAEGQWSKAHDCCVICKGTDFKHQSHGVCSACYQVARTAALRRRDPDPIAERRAGNHWSLQHDACVECGTNEVPYAGKGLCRRCYDRAYMKREMVPGKPWARDYSSCVTCGTTERPHMSKGRCQRCYSRHLYHEGGEKDRARRRYHYKRYGF